MSMLVSFTLLKALWVELQVRFLLPLLGTCGTELLKINYFTLQIYGSRREINRVCNELSPSPFPVLLNAEVRVI